MAKRHEYTIGKIYGCKKLIELHKDGAKTVAVVECIHCGKQSIIRPNQLYRDACISCKCRARTINGLCESRIYRIYHNMLYRCNTPTCNAYFRYGASGIKVCDEWSGRNGFMNFYKWSMEHGYDESLTIDRIDTHGGYSPDNCQWITKAENTAKANKTRQHRRADKGLYCGIDSDGNLHIFENANAFCRERPNFNAKRLRDAARHNRCYLGWLFGFLTDLVSEFCEPQSTIESTQIVEASRVHALCDVCVEAPGTIGEDIVNKWISPSTVLNNSVQPVSSTCHL